MSLEEILIWALDYDDRCSKSTRERPERMEAVLLLIEQANTKGEPIKAYVEANAWWVNA